jgi:hypothetical protein
MASAAAFVLPLTWLAQIATANTNRDGTGVIVDVVTGPASGSRVDSVRIQAVGTTTAGMVRLYLYDGINTRLIRDVPVANIIPSGTVDAWSTEIVVPGGLGIPNGWKLRASTHNAETFNIVARGGNF